MKLDIGSVMKALGGLDPQIIQKVLEILPAVLAVVEKFAPSPATPGVLVHAVDEEPLVAPPPQPVRPSVAAPIFSASQLNVMDVNGEEYNPVNAIGWGSYVRLDSNPKDEHGAPLPAFQIDPAAGVVGSIEWKSLWDGEPDRAGKAHLNVGGRLYNESNGYAISMKVFREGIDDKRHTLDVWCSYTLKDGRRVDSNEVRFFVD